jgi:hypothetical protein
VLSLPSDEDFAGDIVRAPFRRIPALEPVRVQDVGLAGADDPTVLAWSATAGRILLTHDRRTMPRFAVQRVRDGLPMPGVFLIDAALPIRQARDELVLLIECSTHEEWRDLAASIPL